MITFAEPFWLLALPPVAGGLIALFFLSERRRLRDLDTFASARILDRILASYSPLRRRIKEGILLIAAITLITSLARPQLGYEWRETRSRGIDILFALDVSRSMLAEDINPNRLARAKLAIEDFVSRLEGDRIGLIAFAGDAFLQCPLTLDYNAFLQSLDSMSAEIISRGGTDVAAAIDAAAAAFGQTDNFKNLILVSDGEDLGAEGIARAQQVAAQGMRIFSVGIGSPDGAPIPIRNSRGQIQYVTDADGKIVQTALDEITLQSIAEVTGGFYVPLGRGGRGLNEIYEAGLSDIPREELSAQLQRVGLERFQWPLAFAIILLAIEPLLGTRRLLRSASAGTAVIALLMMLSPQPVHATNSKTAWQLLNDGDFATAEAHYRSLAEKSPDDPEVLYNHAIATFNNGNPDLAQRLLERALPKANAPLQSTIHYNLGAIQFKHALEALNQENKEQAINSLTRAESEFLSAFDITPSRQQALINAQAARALIDELEKEQEQEEEQQEDQDQQQDQEQDQQEQDQENQQDQQDQQGEQDSDESEGSEDGQEGEPEGNEGEDGEQSDETDEADGTDGTDGTDETDETDETDGTDGTDETDGTDGTDGTDQSDQSEPITPETGGEDRAGEVAAEPTVLSMEEAMQILDSLNEAERYLPFSSSGRGERRDDERKDW